MTLVDLSPAQRIARRFVASYFSVGDLILYGKYKNKKGRILEFSQDPKGNPTITIEPIPKGRKQNKLMGLFKIWKAPLDKQAVNIMPHEILVARVVNAWNRERFAFVNRGETFENEKYRVHRYNDNFKIWDLTNAGKRGKRVEILYFSPSSYYRGDRDAWMNRMAEVLTEQGDFNGVLSLIKDLQEQFPHELEISKYEERGIDVVPGGFRPVKVHGEHVYVEVGYKDFTIKDLVDRANEPTCIPAMKGGIKAIPTLYRWVQDNDKKIKDMTFKDVLEEMRKLDVPYHYYCAMD